MQVAGDLHIRLLFCLSPYFLRWTSMTSCKYNFCIHVEAHDAFIHVVIQNKKVSLSHNSTKNPTHNLPTSTQYLTADDHPHIYHEFSV